MKAIPQPRWVDDAPAWERREVARHLDSRDDRLRSDYLESPLPLADARDRRRNGEPLEYLLGHCHVAGMTLEVNPSVLVPRPETETLLRDFSDRLRTLPSGSVLDCGTGSGVLAIGLAQRSNRSVFATDVSPDALRLARRNAKCNDATVQFVLADRIKPFNGTLAGIVANLPYVLPDSPRLQPSVPEYEPDRALFVPWDPEDFYGTFLRQAQACLHPEGELWLELDEELLDRISLRSYLPGETKVDLREDDFDQLRYAVISLPG